VTASYSDLQDKVVLVTGGGSGIGEAIVREFARQRARVAFLDIAVAPSRKLAAELQASGSAVHFLPCDLTDFEALRAAFAAAKNQWGPIQVLINNAASDERHATEAIRPRNLRYWG